MEKKTTLPINCPSCENMLKVKTLHCDTCGTSVNGSFNLPVLTCLSLDEQDFVLHFVKQSGSLKEMSKHLDLSYPSVRNILDSIIEKINQLETHKQ